MGEINHDILQFLQDVNLQPPEGTFERVWAGIQQPSQESAAVVSAEIASPLQGEAAFKALQDFELSSPPPPAFNYNQLPTTFINSTPNIGWKQWLPIAASFLLGITVLAVYLIQSGSKSNQPTAVNTNGQTTPTPAATITTIPSDTTLQNKKIGSNSSNNTIAVQSVHQQKSPQLKPFKSNNHQNTLTIGIVQLPIMDHDVLGALMQCSYHQTNDLMAGIARDKTIYLNQYSYLNISDRMVELLQTMYTTKRNKPVRKARKMKARFNKWKKKDANFFDPNTQHNAEDVLDLSEFLFKQ